MPPIRAIPVPADAVFQEGTYPDPVDLGWQAVTVEPLAVAPAANAFAPASGTVYFIGFRPALQGAPAKVYSFVQTAGATLTANQNLMGIYKVNNGNAATPDPSDTAAAQGVATLIAQSADFSSTWTGTGQISAALTAVAGQSAVLLENSFYYLALLSVGTTPPKFWATSVAIAAIVNGNTGVVTNSVAQFPTVIHAAVATAQTALPATVNLGTATVTQQTQTVFAALL